MKLYEIADAYAAVQAAALGAEDDDELFEAALAELDGDLKTKTDNCCRVYRHLVAAAEPCRKEEQRLSTRRRVLERRAMRLKDYIEACLRSAGLERLETTLFSLAIQRSVPRVHVEDESKVPKRWWLVTRALDKRALLDALKDGLKVRGARLEQGEHLRIR